MKKKLLLTLLTLTATATCTFSFTACDNGSENNNDVNQNHTQHEHNYTETVVSPTCTEQGYTLHTCGVCGDNYKDSYTDINLANHTYKDYICTNCDKTAPNAPETEGLEYTLNSDHESYSVSGIGTATGKVIKIPSNYNDKPVTVINQNAFLNCTSLTSVTIPDSVTSISSTAFQGCSSLESISVNENNPNYKSVNNCLLTKDDAELILGCKTSIIPNSVIYIGEWSFYGCKSLTSITIPDSVISIGEQAFGNCTSLTSINIPDSVAEIGNYSMHGYGGAVFSGCSSIESITVDEKNYNYKSVGNCLLSKDGTDLILGCKNSIIPDGVVSIDPYAFRSCTSLKSITIPNNITSIGEQAFFKCTSLTSITLGNNVTSIGDSTFSGCTSLESITIPDSVTSIDRYAFNGCTSLTSITFEGTVTQWNAITKDSDWNKYTGDYTIYCTDGEITKDGTVTMY